MVATGRNSLVCLAAVPLLALPMFVVLMQALRHGAPSRPATAGATAGLLSGALSALLYALQCTDDSPLFVIVWYSLGIGIMAVLGALWGRRALRW